MGRPDYAGMVAKAKANPASALYAKAHAAGMAAGKSVVPVPMVVVQRANLLDDSSAVVKRYEPVMDGVCGFAWVKIRPARGAFVKWCKEHGIGRSDSYEGGYSIWVGEFNQSLTRKEAYASAFAAVLCEAGIKAYSMSRMD